MANTLNLDLHDKVVVLKPDHFKGDERARRFLCLNGFGCNPSPLGGRRIFGRFLIDSEECSVSGESVLKLAEDQSHLP